MSAKQAATVSTEDFLMECLHNMGTDGKVDWKIVAITTGMSEGGAQNKLRALKRAYRTVKDSGDQLSAPSTPSTPKTRKRKAEASEDKLSATPKTPRLAKAKLASTGADTDDVAAGKDQDTK